MEWFTCRVQFVNDIDPLAYSNSSFPEPTRPPFHCFNANIPLANQLPAVHRLLGAPHQVLALRQNCLPFLFINFPVSFGFPLLSIGQYEYQLPEYLSR